MKLHLAENIEILLCYEIRRESIYTHKPKPGKIPILS